MDVLFIHTHTIDKSTKSIQLPFLLHSGFCTRVHTKAEFCSFIFIIFNHVRVCLCIGVCTCVQMFMEARGIGSLGATVVGKVS